MTEAGAYRFEAVHPQTGCPAFDLVEVISESPTDVEFVLQQPPCDEVGGRVFVTGVTGRNAPYTFSSPSGMTEENGRVLRGFSPGEHALVVTDVNGCTYSETFTIFAGVEGLTGEAPEIVARTGDEVELGVITNRGDGALVQWEWRNLPDTLACTNCSSPTLRVMESFNAEVAVVDSSGCALTLQQRIIVTERDLVYLPTAFSPGRRDGTNDVYTVFGDAEFVEEVTSLEIFNRWGGNVFVNRNFPVNDPNAGWDGNSLSGEPLPSGAYVYVVEVRYTNGDFEVFRGGLTLVR